MSGSDKGGNDASKERERIGAVALRYGYIGVDRDNIVDIALEANAGLYRELERRQHQAPDRLYDALVEVDTYLASDPLIWRLTAAAKAGDVLCEVLGADVIQQINANVGGQ